MSESIKNETKKTSTLTIKISNAEQVESNIIDNIEDFVEFAREFYEKMKQLDESIEIGAILYAANDNSNFNWETSLRRREL